MISEKLRFFIKPIINFCAMQFPKNCSCCGKEFMDFKSFLEQTTPIGSVTGVKQNQSLGADIFGILSWVNCKCGSTITISCADSEKEMHQMFQEAVITEAKEQSTTPENVLDEIRQEIRKTVTSMSHLEE